MALTIIFILTSSLASAGFSPERIDGIVMTAEDDAWPVYVETISFDSFGEFNAEITNGRDNPSASGNYNYSKTGEDTAELTYSVEGGFPSFKYYFTFSAEMLGTYRKEADYGTSLDTTSGPFSFTDPNNPGTDAGTGGSDPRGESGNETALAPRDLDGFKIRFSYGEDSSVFEFSSPSSEINPLQRN